MQPDAGGRRREGIHALCEQTQDQSAENVAGAGRWARLAGIGIDDGFGRRERDVRVRTFNTMTPPLCRAAARARLSLSP